MKHANVKRHEVFDAAQTRLRLLISALQDSESAGGDDDLESLDFTTTPAEPAAGEESGDAQPSSPDVLKDN